MLISPEFLLRNILNPPVLFFFLGVFAVLVKSDLDIPQPLPKFFSLFLLVSIGLQGGYKLHKSGFDPYVLVVLLLAMLMAVAVPLYSFFLIRLRLDVFNSAAVAATYGSVSAVTFVTAGSFLNSLGEQYGGYMVAAMTLMESPAIVIGLILVSLCTSNNGSEKIKWRELVREAFFNGSVLLLLGALIVGLLVGEAGWSAMQPMFGDLFRPMLGFFLLDMGLVAARQMGALRKKVGGFVVGFAILVPVLNAIIGTALAKVFGLHKGDAFLFAILCASASYIAVPAAMRLSLPEANPTIYVTMALAITFPFNIVLGIPAYYSVIDVLWG